MLDLDAGVDLDEVELAAGFVVEIFDRSGAAVADRSGQRDGAGAQAASRTSSGSPTAGASSQTFCRRRCSEHSRS